MKWRVTITHKQTGVVDLGEMPERLVGVFMDKLEQGEIGSWSLADLSHDEWERVSLEVEATK